MNLPVLPNGAHWQSENMHLAWKQARQLRLEMKDGVGVKNVEN